MSDRTLNKHNEDVKTKDGMTSRILTVPNILSAIRLMMIPAIVYLYAGCGRYRAALILLAISGLTDVADGFIARKFNQITRLGKVLDPIADKLTQAAVVLCIAITSISMRYVLAVLLIKEILMIAMGLFVLKKTGEIHSARWYGKLSTGILYVSMGLHLLLPGMPSLASYIISGVCITSILLSLLLYAMRYVMLLREHKGASVLQWTVIDWRTVLVALFVAVIVACLLLFKITPQDIVTYTPHNPMIAVAVILLLYVHKSLTVITSVRLIQLAVGIMFPLPYALLLNLVGLVITFTIPYFIGKRNGKAKVQRITENYPLMGRINDFGRNGAFMSSLYVRGTGILPIDPVSMYFGAAGVPYFRYLLGSIVGSIPMLVVRTAFGVSADDPASAGFIVSAVIYALAIAASGAFCLVVYKKIKTSKSHAAQNDEAPANDGDKPEMR